MKSKVKDAIEIIKEFLAGGGWTVTQMSTSPMDGIYSFDISRKIQLPSNELVGKDSINYAVKIGDELEKALYETYIVKYKIDGLVQNHEELRKMHDQKIEALNKVIEDKDRQIADLQKYKNYCEVKYTMRHGQSLVFIPKEGE